MDIWVASAGENRHRMVMVTASFRHDAVLETRSLLLHDFAHYAVESALGIEHGFYGLVAAGHADPVALREHTVDPDVWAGLMAVEQQVVQLQTAFKWGDGAEMPGWQVLRSVHGAWRKVGSGEALHLVWPGAPPRVEVPPWT